MHNLPSAQVFLTEGRYLTRVNEYQPLGILMDRMPNVAVSSTSGGGGMSKKHPVSDLVLTAEIIKTVKMLCYTACTVLYIRVECGIFF